MTTPDANAPTGTGTFDKIPAVYVKGSPMTVKTTRFDADAKPVRATLVLTDASGNTTNIVLAGTVTDPVTAVMTDPDRTWTMVPGSDDGVNAVFTAVA